MRIVGCIALLHLIFFPICASEHDEQKYHRVMVFAPHPDDDIIGCGGSLIMHKKNGAEIVVVYMTSGDKGGKSSKSSKRAKSSSNKVARIREQEAQNACALLGITELIFLRERDGKLNMYTRETFRKIKDIIL